MPDEFAGQFGLLDGCMLGNDRSCELKGDATLNLVGGASASRV
ncbi:MAG TPA: hypothetical protein VFK02_32050 [Kofleriaceae bacterium]|nr:hypothetical protein [Kofleriaceae bacterium]